jgi:hypothetical protein
MGHIAPRCIFLHQTCEIQFLITLSRPPVSNALPIGAAPYDTMRCNLGAMNHPALDVRDPNPRPVLAVLEQARLSASGPRPRGLREDFTASGMRLRCRKNRNAPANRPRHQREVPCLQSPYRARARAGVAMKTEGLVLCFRGRPNQTPRIFWRQAERSVNAVRPSRIYRA